MVVKELELLSDGYFEIDMGMLVWMKQKYYGKKYRCALKSLLVITDDDRILVDTGIGDLPDDLMRINGVVRERNLLEDLEGVGMGPGDITAVINTHLHFDHCGWNRSFNKARHIVQEEELRYSKEPHRFQKASYYRPFLDDVGFEIVDGDVEIFDGVHLVRTPGHTPGHQSVVVEIGDRRYIFCGDAGALMENIKRRNVIGISTDPVQCLESIDKLRAMDGIHIYGHDNRQMHLDILE